MNDKDYFLAKKTQLFKLSCFNSRYMAEKYLIREIVINERFARAQKVCWAEQKTIIFNIVNDLKQFTLFGKNDKDKPAYNLVDNYDGYATESSLSVIPLKSDDHDVLFDSKLMDDEERNIKTIEVSDSNYQSSGFITRFRIGLIKHEDILLFKNGTEERLWKYFEGDNAGKLSKTAFGIIVSEKRQKLFLVKQSGLDNVGYQELEYYLSEKSKTFRDAFRTAPQGKIFKLQPIFSTDGFDEENIGSMKMLEIGVNNDLINDYKTRTGKQDAFYSIVLEPCAKLFGIGRTSTFNISFSEQGDQDAKKLFTDLYSSFVSIQDEALERIFTNFKIVYEDVAGKDMAINFKRNKIYSYEPEAENRDFTHVFDAFTWLSIKLGSVAMPTEKDDTDG